VTFSLTTSSSVELSAALITATNDTFDSYATDLAVLVTFMDPDPNDGSMAMLLGGEATAVGQDTLAAGSLQAVLDGTGSVGSADGNATFLSVAASPGDELAFATADSFGTVSGVDFLIATSSTTEIIHQAPEQSVAIASSETTFFGLDFDRVISATEAESFGAPSEPGTAAMEGSGSLAEMDGSALDPETDWEAAFGQPSSDSPMMIEGNVATMDVFGEVFGSDTLLDVQVSVLTVEDTLSTVAGELVAAVG
jgi:hypothetical protein